MMCAPLVATHHVTPRYISVQPEEAVYPGPKSDKLECEVCSVHGPEGCKWCMQRCKQLLKHVKVGNRTRRGPVK